MIAEFSADVRSKKYENLLLLKGCWQIHDAKTRATEILAHLKVIKTHQKTDIERMFRLRRCLRYGKLRRFYGINILLSKKCSNRRGALEKTKKKPTEILENPFHNAILRLAIKNNTRKK
jgi:hypothetical protein